MADDDGCRPPAKGVKALVAGQGFRRESAAVWAAHDCGCESPRLRIMVMMLATIRCSTVSVSLVLSDAPNAPSGVISDRAVAATAMIVKIRFGRLA